MAHELQTISVKVLWRRDNVRLRKKNYSR